jgi:phosphoserine phosphatase
MKKILIFTLFAAVFFLSNSNGKKSETAIDQLPSWNVGIRTKITNYIDMVTDPKNPGFIPESERFAVFDNDGTLWAEQPTVEELFIIYYAGKMAEKNPSLKYKSPFNRLGDFYNNGKFIIKDRKIFDEIVGIVHEGMTNEEFQKVAENFFRETKYPGLNVPLSKIVYQPQLELMNYLRKNGFKVYICSGGESDFMRVISEKYYGIPKEQVIGSELAFDYNDVTNLMTRRSKLYTDNNGRAKAVNIYQRLGRPAVFAVGNIRTGGDIYMLRYSQASKYPSFQLLIDHDDVKREFLYSETDNISVEWAKKYNWNVVSMKNDWKQIFPR